MKSNHLTDETLQAFTLGEIHDDIIATHLTICTQCQKTHSEYQFLVDSVQKIKTESFSFDVGSLVIEKIKVFEAQKEKNANIVLYMCLLIVSIGAFGLVYPYLQIVFAQFESFSTMKYLFVLVSVLGVVIFLLSDLLRQYKQKDLLLS